MRHRAGLLARLRGRAHPDRLRGRAHRDERGVIYSTEFAGMLPLLLIAALAMWQLLLIMGVINAAESAARAGAREGDSQAAVEALPEWAQPHGDAWRHPDGACEPAHPDQDETGERVNVCVTVPLLTPGVPLEPVRIRRSVEMPH